ncbi:26S proteasome non-ATPase regulatory subunit 9 [Planococcus citri]|uniref:26S proteasome non-ATPase regulatory subunit 9 n=1 Tax=Planococcus citri TaxID=170843 RepID=UPI0031F99AF4
MEKMVNRNFAEPSNAVSTARQTALNLENDKRKLEEELREWLAIIEKNNTDMNEALVDAEGYPRADIDVYQVRHARHKVICIRNDLKKIMIEIEKCLHAIHAEGSLSVQMESMDVEITSDTPIARVTSITAGSPSDEAGLQVGDLITNFGSVNSSNFNGLADISNIVKHSINQIIKVIVLRDEVTVKVYLKPHLWSGQGVLGCVILPFESVER